MARHAWPFWSKIPANDIVMNFKTQLRMARRHIGRLSALAANPLYIEDMDEQRLATLGARAIVLDHDGILGPNMSHGPDKAGEELLKRAVAVFGAGSVFVLSNTRRTLKERRSWYENNLKDVVYLTAKRKPDQDGILQASWASGVEVEAIAVVDDGLLTGTLMALQAGAIPVYAVRREMAESARARLARLATAGTQRLAVRSMGLIFG